jgi:1-deoxy-D-xylulose-5-phosphate synthase
MVYPAVDAGNKLAADGIQSTVVNARFVKPLDKEMILELARKMSVIVTVEDAYLAGGFGSAVLELLEENGLSDTIKFIRMGVPDEIVSHGDPKHLMAAYGLDADGIFARVQQAARSLDRSQTDKPRIKAVK